VGGPGPGPLAPPPKSGAAVSHYAYSAVFLFYMANARTRTSSGQLTMGQALCLISCNSSDTQNTEAVIEQRNGPTPKLTKKLRCDLNGALAEDVRDMVGNLTPNGAFLKLN